MLLMAASPLAAQDAGVLTPDASAAKAKAILQQAGQALGGDAYLNVHDSDCSGRAAQFEHSGALGGYIQFHSYRMMPDKSRTEYGTKNNIVDVYTEKQAWALDRGGVSEQPADVVADFQEQLRTDFNTILRFRMDDASLYFRYGGSEVVDLKIADWVEITDRSGHTIRVAIDQKTHLPVRSVITNRDSEGALVERSALYSNYHLIDGIQTPFQVVRFRNGQQISQVFYDSCSYDSNLSPDLFTRASLEQRFREVGKKRK